MTTLVELKQLIAALPPLPNPRGQSGVAYAIAREAYVEAERDVWRAYAQLLEQSASSYKRETTRDVTEAMALMEAIR